MNSERDRSYRGAVAIIASGMSLIITLFFTQYFVLAQLPTDLAGRIVLTEENISNLDRLSIPSFVLVFSALLLCSIGIYSLLKRIWPNWSYLRYRVVSWHFSPRRIFSLSVIAYFLFISLLSSTIVYNPIHSFTETYGVSVPSIHIMSCCGYPGSFPVMSTYITDNFGLMIVPLNMITFFFLSIFVGINTILFIAITKQNLSKNKRCNILLARSASNWGRFTRIIPSPYIGPLVGLFAGCPACSSIVTLLPLILGTGSTSSLSVLSTVSYQGSIYQFASIISSFAILSVFPIYLAVKREFVLS